MEGDNKGNKKATKTNRVSLAFWIILTVILLLPCLGASLMANHFVNAQKTACDVIQSGLSQINATGSSQPTTAAQCKQMVDFTKPMTYGIWIFGAYVLFAVLCGFAYAGFLIFGGGMKSRTETRTKPK